MTKYVQYNWHIVPSFVLLPPKGGHLSRTGYIRGYYMPVNTVVRLAAISSVISLIKDIAETDTLPDLCISTSNLYQYGQTFL